jgi:hypothetical protein
MSGGLPTKLVRDQGRESYDDPPWYLPSGPLVPAVDRPPAGDQAQSRRAWRAWTVWPPALLTPGLLGFSLLMDFVIELSSCFDSCEPMGQVDVSASVDLVAGAATLWLLGAGMLMPARRRAITLTCWGMCAAAAWRILLLTVTVVMTP